MVWQGAFKNDGIAMSGFIDEYANDGIVAFAGGGKSGATPLTWQTTRVITVATSGDSVLLPPSATGRELQLMNHGANPMQVYGSGSDTIDDVATGTGVSQMQGSMVIYTCAATGAWYTEGLATGYVKGLGLQTMQPATIAANTTDSQAAGTLLTAMINVVTATSNPGSVVLPASAPGMNIQILAATAADAISVYPSAGGTGTEAINALAANAKYTMGALTSATFNCVVAGQWYTNPRTAS